MNHYQVTYRKYKRPPLSPPPWLFGVVWPILYLFIFISYIYVGYQVIGEVLPSVVGVPFALNLVANGMFTYFQFKLKNNLLAAIDVVVLLATIIITMLVIWPYYPWVVYLQIPYLIWVLFATYLQIGVTILNQHKASRLDLNRP